MKDRKIFVSSLPAGLNTEDQIVYAKQVEQAGADAYHLDIMDGKFVPNKTIDYTHVLAVKQNTNLFLDVHLMCEKPKKLIDLYAKAGANAITIHIEAFRHSGRLKSAIKKIRAHNIVAGLAVDLDTDIEVVYPYANSIDSVLIMSVQAGAGGQKFNELAFEKISALHKQFPHLNIEVDGGINNITSTQCWASGASCLAVGSYVANAKSMPHAIKELRK